MSTPAGVLKLARNNLQSRVKEEDSIIDVENAVFDLGVMESLCFFFIDQRVFVGMITKFIKFVELNFSVITRGFDIKVCTHKGPTLYGRPRERHAYQVCPIQEATFWPTVPFRNSSFSKPRLDTSTCPTLFVGMTRWRDDVDSIFKHDYLKTGHMAKIGYPAITYDCTRGTKSGEERFKKFRNNSGIIGGERFCFNPF
ncbi:hypothetical protein Tco_1122182 [Tanacetum coccineum]|uniref:Uncharacterized protein n=1 Tax=Tanacetum coccineum TaxID=301880 RepID=A0ABQ5IZW1_9ASTR